MRLAKQIVGHLSKGVRRAGQRLRPDAHARLPTERSVLDDLVLTQPWSVVVKVLRWRARHRLAQLRPGVTVVIVNWNTVEVTSDVLRAVRRLSPPELEIILVDNGSTDGSRERFKTWPGIRAICLPSNAHHGPALDIGFFASRTTVTVTLDSDAIPLRRGWYEPAVGPITAGDAFLSGVRSGRGFVHPVYLAADTAEFVRRCASFQRYKERRAIDEPEVWGVTSWDTGELVTPAFAPQEVHFVHAPAEPPVAGLPGGFVSDVLYHHGAVTQHNRGGVPQAVVAEWRAACEVLGLAHAIAP